MPDLRLPGCATRPLIGYLKALGLLRILTRQVDSAARGRWSGGTFELRTTLSRDELEDFLCTTFKPSPVLSPWNGRSGFYPIANATAVKALAAVEHAEDDRFEPYRALIGQTRQILADIAVSVKPADAEREVRDRKLRAITPLSSYLFVDPAEKDVMVRTLRARWPDAAVEWLDAAIVIAGDTPAYPPLLGSGGNEGSYDFSSNYMQAVVRALSSAELLRGAMLGSSVKLDHIALAHFQGDASPTSSPTGGSPSLGNPWDLVLALEGSLSLVGGAARRHADGVKGLLTAPFTVRSTAAGYGGAVAGEKGRAELWLPLWTGWATNAEIDNLIRESRAQVRSGPQRRRAATTGLDFARAAGELGVARGIDAFERYTILERSGQANLAVPAGRIEVKPRPSAAALASIDRWLEGLLRFAGDDKCPTAIIQAIRGLERSCFEMATRGRAPDALAVLQRMGAVEAALARSGAAIDSYLAPIHSTPADPWIDAADDHSADFAIAVSIASLQSDNKAVPAIRDYLHGTRRHQNIEHRNEFDPARRHLIAARSPAGLLAAIHARSHLERARTPVDAGSSPSRLGFERGRWCDVDGARMLATGALDPARILELVRGLVLLDHRFAKGRLQRRDSLLPAPAPAYDMLALAWWWRPARPPAEEDPVELGPRPGWAARLAAGAVDHVIRDATIRLRMARMVPVADPRDLAAGAPDGELLAGALLAPLSDRDLARLEKTVTMPKEEDEQ